MNDQERAALIQALEAISESLSRIVGPYGPYRLADNELHVHLGLLRQAILQMKSESDHAHVNAGIQSAIARLYGR